MSRLSNKNLRRRNNRGSHQRRRSTRGHRLISKLKKGGEISMFEEKRCVVCKNLVDWDVVKDEFPELFLQADALDIDSLTEQEQVVLEGNCCSLECYIEM